MYEELGWELPNGATPAKKGKATPSKRVAHEAGAEAETPTKKPRTPRKKKSATPEKDNGAEDDEEMGEGVKKEEEIDEV